MLNLSTKTLSVAAALAFAATGVLAQAPASQTTTSTATTATTIGVTPQEAKEALQKAKPQADTGTLVRTEPSTAERARRLAAESKGAVQINKPAQNSVPAHAATGTHQPAKAAQGHSADKTPRPADVPSHTTTGTVTNTTTPSMAMGITGTLPGATPSNMDATNTRDNADKSQGSAAPADTMGNRNSTTPAKK